MRARILTTHIQGYRCLEDVRFDPDPRMTVVVGANGSGKSSLLDALALVSDLMRLGGGAFSGDARGQPGNAPSPSEFLTAGRPQPLEVGIGFQADDAEYTYTVKVELSRTLFRILEERLHAMGGVGPRLLAERDATGARIRRGSGTASQVVPVGLQDQTTVVSLGADVVSYPEVTQATRFLGGICLLQPVPVLMRAPGSTSTDLGWPDRYGRDLSTRVFRLQNARPRSVADWLGLLGFVGWSELRTPIVNGQVVPEILEGKNPNPIRLAQTSDGSLAAAWLASLVMDPPEAVSVLLIDEPGTSYFPHTLSHVAEMLVSLSHLRQVVVATQARDLVEGTGNLDNAWLMNRQAGGPARLRRFPKEDDLVAEEVAISGIGEAAFHAVAPNLEGEGTR